MRQHKPSIGGPVRLPEEENWHEVLDEAPVGFLHFRPQLDRHKNVKNFVLTSYNRKADELMGCFLSEDKQYLVTDVLAKESDRDWLTVFQKVYETGEPTRELMSLSNTCVDRVHRIQVEGSAGGIAVFLTDIHELYQTVQGLTEDEKRYRLLYETSLDGIFLTDDDFTLLDVNPRFSALLLHEKFVPGKPLASLFHEEEAYALFSERLKEKQYVEEFETLLCSSSGAVKPCMINCIPVTEEGGGIMFYQGVVRDMTLKKKTERELLVAEKLSLTGKLARTIAHEVRNPLTNLRLAADQMKDDLPGDYDGADFYFDLMTRSADRIEQLINDLLHSSRPKELNLQEEDINAVVDEALALVRDRLKLKDMQLHTQFDESAPPIKCDKALLKVALLNVLLNAVEAMQPEEGILTVQTISVEDLLEIVVKDNGHGISPDAIDHLFEPFYTGKKEGAGLGLTATMNIMRSHEGSIDVLSELGVGTEFTLRLPIDPL